MADWEDDPAPVASMRNMNMNGETSSGSSWAQNNGGGTSWADSSDSPSGFGAGRGRGRARGRGGSSGGGGGGGSCFKCGEDGHFSRECPSSGGGGGGGFGGGGGDRKPVKCFKCQEEGHMSRECPNADSGFGGGGDRKPMTCFKCQQEGHMSRECPNEDTRPPRSNKCFKCQEEGHMSRECPNEGTTNGGGSSWGERSGGGGGGDRKSGACYKCNEEGHMARDCPTEGGDGKERPKGCFKCGDEDHMARECTKPPEECIQDPDRKAPMTYVPTDLTDDQLFEQGVAKGINFTAHQNIQVKISGDPPIPPAIKSFQEAKLRTLLLENCIKAGYETPTPVQRLSIPVVMAGRDLMACAQTGSGKTAAFLLPMLHHVLENNLASGAMDPVAKPISLVIAPTRELAIQIYNQARMYSKGSVVKVCVVYGGTSVAHQHKGLQRGCHVLVCTPGRLVGYMEQGYISFESLKYLVLDEADRMLDMGFKDSLEKVVKHHTMTKDERQTLMFSATFPSEIQELAKHYLNRYVFAVVGMVGAANKDVKQTLLNVEKSQKRETLLEFLQESLKKNEKEKILVFVETKRTADFIAAYLSSNQINTTSIHGDRFQNQREEALSQFRFGIMNVLVATSVAARGLDINGIGYVINYDMPKEIDEYVHRIGRTGRVGNQGNAVSYFDDGQDGHLANGLIKLLADAQQEVPDWLKQSATGGSYGSGTSYRGNTGFGATDIRTKDGGKGSVHSYRDSAQEQFAAPAEDEAWD